MSNLSCEHWTLNHLIQILVRGKENEQYNEIETEPYSIPSHLEDQQPTTDLFWTNPLEPIQTILEFWCPTCLAIQHNISWLDGIKELTIKLTRLSYLFEVWWREDYSAIGIFS